MPAREKRAIAKSIQFAIERTYKDERPKTLEFSRQRTLSPSIFFKWINTRVKVAFFFLRYQDKSFVFKSTNLWKGQYSFRANVMGVKRLGNCRYLI